MANIISSVVTTNTFYQWLSTTQNIVDDINSLREGGNTKTYVANTNMRIENDVTIGGDLTVSGNITLDVIGFDNLNVNGSGYILEDLFVSGNVTILKELDITRDLYVGNTTSIVQNTATFAGTTFVSYGNHEIANVTLLVGSAGNLLNTTSAKSNSAAVYANGAFTAANVASADALAFSIALG